MTTFIFHQVNCMGAFGAGFAKYLASVSPRIPSDYISHVSNFQDKHDLLGTYYVTKLNPNISIVHLFSQYGYGRGERYTDYGAMDKSLHSFYNSHKYNAKNTYICPYKMGCGLAGGDWNIVEKIVKKYGIKPIKNIRLNHSGNKKYIAFVGSRNTPESVIYQSSMIAHKYAKTGYILRSGNAEGFDQVLKNIEEDSREIYLPYTNFGPDICGKNIYVPSDFDNYKEAVNIVNRLHPNKNLKEWQMQYLARDVYQVLGLDLNTPVLRVYCWTEDGVDCVKDMTEKTGGTAMAIRVAESWGIPVMNLNRISDNSRYFNAE